MEVSNQSFNDDRTLFFQTIFKNSVDEVCVQISLDIHKAVALKKSLKQLGNNKIDASLNQKLSSSSEEVHKVYKKLFEGVQGYIYSNSKELGLAMKVMGLQMGNGLAPISFVQAYVFPKALEVTEKLSHEQPEMFEDQTVWSIEKLEQEITTSLDKPSFFEKIKNFFLLILQIVWLFWCRFFNR